MCNDLCKVIHASGVLDDTGQHCYGWAVNGVWYCSAKNEVKHFLFGTISFPFVTFKAAWSSESDIVDTWNSSFTTKIF